MNELEKIKAITYSIKEFYNLSHTNTQKVAKFKHEVPWLEITFRLGDKIFKVFAQYYYDNGWDAIWSYYTFRYNITLEQVASMLCNALDIDLQRPELPNDTHIFCNSLGIDLKHFLVSQIKEFLLEIIHSRIGREDIHAILDIYN